MTKEQLLEQRTAKVAAMRAILDKAKTEKRDRLASAEQVEYDVLRDHIQALDGRIDSFAPATQATGRSSDDGPSWEDRLRDGRIVTMRHTERVSDYLRARGQYRAEDEGVSFGQLARAYITGRQDHLNDAERRALGASTITGGGILAPSPVAADVLDLARAQSRVFQAGAQLVPMTSGTLTLTKITDGVTPEWKEENALGTESDAAFGAVILTSRTLQAFCKMSLELVEDAPNAGEAIEREFSAAIAQEFDRVSLIGSGFVHEPRGIQNWGGVNARELGSGNGATPADYDFLIDAIGDVLGAHGNPTAILYNSTTWGVLAKLKEAVNLQPLRVPDAVAAVPRLVTNQIPNDLTVGTSPDCSLAFTGDFRMLAIGVRIGFQFEVARAAGEAFQRGQVEIRGRLRGDVGLLRANHFTVTSGIRD
jgi:HK97 family phage major capsid protein